MLSKGWKATLSCMAGPFYFRLLVQLSRMKTKAFVNSTRKITWRKPGGKNLFLELECPSPHWKNQDLVSSGIEEMRCFMRHSAQCLTRAGYQLYNAVALFVISLLYSKCHRSTHTRCLQGCVAYKTDRTLTRLTRGKSLSRPYPETQM